MSEKKKSEGQENGLKDGYLQNGSALKPELLKNIRQFLETHYVPEEKIETHYDRSVQKNAEKSSKIFKTRKIEIVDGEPALTESPSQASKHLKKIIEHTGETFQQHLFHLIDEKGLTDAEVYKRAHIDRRLFSKIRQNENYVPRKKNVLSLALALHLNSDEATDFLQRAGMAISPGSKSDLIVAYCIRHKIYDINVVNALLDEFGEPTLG